MGPPRAAPLSSPERRFVPLAMLLALSLAGAACGTPAPTTWTQPPGTAVGGSAAPRSTGSPATSAAPSGGGLRPDPNAAAYGLRDPRPPTRMQGTVHDVEVAVHERFMTVAEGFVQAVWTIGGTVPGPVLRVGARDTVRVHLVNAPPRGSYPAQHPAVNLYPHAVAFDGSTGSRDDQVRPIGPEEDARFEFRADHPGVWMYHGSTEPLLQDIAYGMYGMMIVEPEGGLDAVGQELFFIQGEWYLGGQYPPHPPPPSLAGAAAANPVPDFVVLNGIADQYLDHPIPVETGRRVRAFVLNAGPNLPMAFRVEGATFDRVLRDGLELAAGGGSGGSDAVELAPGQGAIVEFTIPGDGVYRVLTGERDVAEPGAAALLQAGDATP